MDRNHLRVWLFGRGASIASGVTWEEPQEWEGKDRQERIRNIDRNLTEQMQNIPVGENPYSRLLFMLENKPRQKNLFVTTNWDYLLQREINSKNYTSPLEWLEDSQVFHLNGSVEKWGDTRYRSPILLPNDNSRKNSLEFQRAFNQIIWANFFVIVGLSFKHKVDAQLIELLKPHEDNMPFGEGEYLIVNDSLEDLKRLESILKRNFPRSKVIKVQDNFKSWVDANFGAQKVPITR